MIEINKLEKKYSQEFSLYIDSLSVQQGDRIALIGSNGSGKSTLLKIIASVVKPTAGSCIVDCPSCLIGYEPQDPFCYNMNVRKNICLGLDTSKKSSDNDRIVDNILEKCCLTHLQKKRADALSGGEKQRMCFARMLVRPYKVLLMDEPLSAADIEMSEKMEQVLLSFCKENNTALLFSTHLPQQSIRLSTKIIIMHDGRVAEYGDTEKILRHPQTEFGQKFLANWSL